MNSMVAVAGRGALNVEHFSLTLRSKVLTVLIVGVVVVLLSIYMR